MTTVDDSNLETYLDALQFTLQMKPEFRRCRKSGRHDFVNGRPIRGHINRDGTLYQETACGNCGTIIKEEMTARGYYIRSPRYVWPDGYLKKPGEPGMRRDADASAAMRAVLTYERLGRPLPGIVTNRPPRKRAASRRNEPEDLSE